MPTGPHLLLLERGRVRSHSHRWAAHKAWLTHVYCTECGWAIPYHLIPRHIASSYPR